MCVALFSCLRRRLTFQSSRGSCTAPPGFFHKEPRSEQAAVPYSQHRSTAHRFYKRKKARWNLTECSENSGANKSHLSKRKCATEVSLCTACQPPPLSSWRGSEWGNLSLHSSCYSFSLPYIFLCIVLPIWFHPRREEMVCFTQTTQFQRHSWRSACAEILPQINNGWAGRVNGGMWECSPRTRPDTHSSHGLTAHLLHPNVM